MLNDQHFLRAVSRQHQSLAIQLYSSLKAMAGRGQRCDTLSLAAGHKQWTTASVHLIAVLPDSTRNSLSSQLIANSKRIYNSNSSSISGNLSFSGASIRHSLVQWWRRRRRWRRRQWPLLLPSIFRVSFPFPSSAVPLQSYFLL